MTLDRASSLIGDLVEYRAFTGARVELGTITDVSPGWVMVRFLGVSYSRAIHPRDLTELRELAGI